MVQDIAQAILIPYLFVFGFDMDPESVAECRDAIELRRKENIDVHDPDFTMCDNVSRDQPTSLQPRSRTSPCSND